MAIFADQFREARGGSNVNLINRPKKPDPVHNVTTSSSNFAQHKTNNFRGSFPRSKSEKRCFLCNRTGHYAYECKTKQNTLAVETELSSGADGQSKQFDNPSGFQSNRQNRGHIRGRGL